MTAKENAVNNYITLIYIIKYLRVNQFVSSHKQTDKIKLNGQAERLPFKKTASFLADYNALFSPEKGLFYVNQ